VFKAAAGVPVRRVSPVVLNPVVLIGHSQGSTMGAYYLAQGGEAVDGFIAIGMGSVGSAGPMDNLAHLREIRLPMLDLYGSEDLPGVVSSTAQRRQAAQGNADYRTLETPGADHFYEGEEELLLQAVGGWLAENFAATDSH